MSDGESGKLFEIDVVEELISRNLILGFYCQRGNRKKRE